MDAVAVSPQVATAGRSATRSSKRVRDEQPSPPKTNAFSDHELRTLGAGGAGCQRTKEVSSSAWVLEESRRRTRRPVVDPIDMEESDGEDVDENEAEPTESGNRILDMRLLSDIWRKKTCCRQCARALLRRTHLACED